MLKNLGATGIFDILLTMRFMKILVLCKFENSGDKPGKYNENLIQNEKFNLEMMI